jgi:hypothetical protein
MAAARKRRLRIPAMASTPSLLGALTTPDLRGEERNTLMNRTNDDS